MKREDLFFDSKDSCTKIHAARWMPDDNKPVAVFQIIHGMAEHVDRYEGFAEFLVSKGFVVTADDHLGHGKSLNNGLTGYFAKEDPATTVVEDCYSLTKLTKDSYPGIPYFVLGHSMGSFIIRNYMSAHGSEIAGAIVMGTGNQPKGLVMATKIMSSLACVFGKSKKPCKTLDKIAFGTYCAKIENPRTPVDWLTKDTEIVDKYIADPLCGFVFTGNGFKTLGELLYRLHDQSRLAMIPKSLPVLITAGADDPVGEYGKGPKEVYELYQSLGIKDVSLKLYDNDRHEILNETDKETVYADIYDWLSRRL